MIHLESAIYASMSPLSNDKDIANAMIIHMVMANEERNI